MSKQFSWKPEGKWGFRKPRYLREDNIKTGMCEIGIWVDWINKVLWKHYSRCVKIIRSPWWLRLYVPLKRRSTSCYLNTRCYIPEGCHLHTHRRANLKSNLVHCHVKGLPLDPVTCHPNSVSALISPVCKIHTHAQISNFPLTERNVVHYFLDNPHSAAGLLTFYTGEYNIYNIDNTRFVGV
jgi:hypothetical protein